jgi:hypothetical protein
MRRRLFGMIMVCAFVSFSLACGSSESTDESTRYAFTGNLDESNVKVGMVADGTQASVFFCGEGITAETTTRWFTSFPAQANEDFNAAAAGWTLRGRFTDGEASGTLDRGDGRLVRWSTKRAAAGEGLYDRKEPNGRAGVVFFSGGAQGIYISKGIRDQFLQITPLRPAGTLGEDVDVKYIAEGKERILTVSPASP